MRLSVPNAENVSRSLLRAASTHSSYRNEHPGCADNERLEFLGDAVIGLVSSEYLYNTYPQEPEGRLSLLRAGMVSASSLAAQARALNLGDQLRIGKGGDKTGLRHLDSVLADAFEAVVGADLLDQGYEAAREYVLHYLRGSENLSGGKDSKTLLQEHMQSTSAASVEYAVIAVKGPDHARLYTVQVSHEGSVLGTGVGTSKKEAEQEAAADALRRLRA